MIKTMDSAIERHKEHMKRIEREKLMQHEDFNWRIRAEQEVVAREKRLR